MNVAIFASDFYPSVGGVQEVVRQTAHALHDAGDRAMVLTNLYPKNLPASDEYEGIPVRRHVFRVPERNFKQMAGALLVGPWTLRRICAQLWKHRTDLIHVHCCSSNAYYAVRAKKRLGLPLVLTMHGELSMDATRLFERSEFARRNYRETIEAADAITACSDYALQEAERFSSQPFAERSKVVYSGVRVDDFRDARPYQHPRPYIFAIGRLAWQKGFDVLLAAFAEVLKTDSSHDLIIAGDGPDQQKLADLARDLGIVQHVKFFGRATREATVGLFTGCSVFVLPSRHEAMGIVSLEAMAARKPVVASRVGGVPEVVVDGETGILVEPDSVTGFAAAIISLLGDPQRRQSMGMAGLSRARVFDWCRINQQFRDIYESLVASSHGMAPAVAS
ncbi:MAG: glycosyltransferase family 4 protein [Planctomycetota bacterium]|nr:glycosyltransferase family 4 protein [Planctomycetota bacterium]